MRKVFFLFVVIISIFSSCKKEEENGCPKDCRGVITHYGYVKGIIVDSVSALPLPNAIVYLSEGAFSSGFNNPVGGVDTTDANGAYTRTIVWYTGRSLSSGNLSRPSDSADVFINSHTSTVCNFIKFKWWQVIENDTISVSTISAKPYAYVTTHVKEVLPVSFGIYLYWNHAVGPSPVLYPANSNTIVTRQICPNLKTFISWSGNNDSVFVNSGDTAFVNVFY